MSANVISRLVPLASLLGAIGIVAACGSSEADPEATGGTAGSGGTPASGGKAGSGGTPASGGTPSTGGTSAMGAGGAAGAGEGELECIPELPDVCFGPPGAAPGFPFVTDAWALGTEESVPNAEVRSTEAGTVCMSGTNAGGVALDFALADSEAPFTILAANEPLVLTAAQLFHAEDLGITGLSFTVETPPSTGVSISIAMWDLDRGGPSWAAPEVDGNPVVITTSGMTTTLAFADFVTEDAAFTFDANAFSQLSFSVGQGSYDFCVSNLKFLDANGDEVTQ